MRDRSNEIQVKRYKAIHVMLFLCAALSRARLEDVHPPDVLAYSPDASAIASGNAPASQPDGNGCQGQRASRPIL
jgi:hypothetical protein